MAIKEAIIGMIEASKSVPVPVEEVSNLYTNLGFDSLSFIALLTKIEGIYSITFDLIEMGKCLQVDRLIALVENKIGERNHHDTALAHRSGELG